MRKTEAQHLREQLSETYEGDLELMVLDLNDLGIRVPSSEHPYFVIGVDRDQSGDEEPGQQEENEQEESGKPVKKVLKERFKVVVWDNRSSGWKVERMRSLEVQDTSSIPFQLYIYDTRQRKFVPLKKFRLPTGSE